MPCVQIAGLEKNHTIKLVFALPITWGCLSRNQGSHASFQALITSASLSYADCD